MLHTKSNLCICDCSSDKHNRCTVCFVGVYSDRSSWKRSGYSNYSH